MEFNYSTSIEEKLNSAINSCRINTIDKLKNFSNLDASLVRLIIGPIDINTKIYTYSPIDESVCEDKDCSILKSIKALHNFTDELNDNSAYEELLDDKSIINKLYDNCKTCPYDNIKCHTVYINPKKKYNLYNMARSLIDKPRINFSKLLIKIMIVLQCWPAELINKSGKHDGVLKNVYIPDLANILKCNINFLEDCLCNLGNLGLIHLDKLSPHLYDITIPDYYLKFEKANQGGKGYIQIDRKILKALIEEKSITALRGMLLQLLRNPFAYNTDIPNFISIDEFRTVMPRYVSYKALFDKALKNTIFESVYDKFSRQFVYLPKADFISVTEQKNDLMQKNVTYIAKALNALKPTFITNKNSTIQDPIYRSNINSIINNHKDTLPGEILSSKPLLSFLKDSLLVSVEYGFLNVIKAIRTIERNYRVYGNEIKNAGAMLRTYCCYNMLEGTT